MDNSEDILNKSAEYLRNNGYHLYFGVNLEFDVLFACHHCKKKIKSREYYSFCGNCDNVTENMILGELGEKINDLSVDILCRDDLINCDSGITKISKVIIKLKNRKFFGVILYDVFYGVKYFNLSNSKNDIIIITSIFDDEIKMNNFYDIKKIEIRQNRTSKKNK